MTKDLSNHCCYLDLVVLCLQINLTVLFVMADRLVYSAWSYLRKDTHCVALVICHHADWESSLAAHVVQVFEMTMAGVYHCSDPLHSEALRNHVPR